MKKKSRSKLDFRKVMCVFLVVTLSLSLILPLIGVFMD